MYLTHKVKQPFQEPDRPPPGLTTENMTHPDKTQSNLELIPEIFAKIIALQTMLRMERYRCPMHAQPPKEAL